MDFTQVFLIAVFVIGIFSPLLMENFVRRMNTDTRDGDTETIQNDISDK